MTRLFVVLALVVSAVALGVRVAGAFPLPNVPHYPGSTTSWPMGNRIASTSTMTWEAVDGAGWSGWHDVVSRALDSGSPDALSLGNVLNDFLREDGRGQITIREALGNEAPDMRQYAVTSAFLEAKCGEGSWYTACVYLLNGLTVPAYYRAATMMLWSYASQAPVVRHETFHTVARACDQYRAGCPRASDGVWEGTVVCTGNLDSLMDCGGAARTVTALDYRTFVTAYPAVTAFLQFKQVPVCASEGWDECVGRWRFANGTSFDPITQFWYSKIDLPEWGACNALGHRWNPQILAWGRSGVDANSRAQLGFDWSYAPAC